MGLLIELLLFAAPFAAYAVWRRFEPDAAPPRALLLALLGLGCALAALAFFGFDRGMERGTAYVPAVLDAEGRIVPGHPETR